MSNKLKGASFAAFCCVVFCSTGAFAQAAGADGCDWFPDGLTGDSGDYFSSGAIGDRFASSSGSDAFSSGFSPFKMRKQRAKFVEHEMEALPPDPDLTGRAGDEFSGYLTESEAQYYLTHTGSSNDPFDSTVAHVENGVMVYGPAPNNGALIIGRSFAMEKRWDAFFAGHASRPVKLSVLDEHGWFPMQAWNLPRVVYKFTPVRGAAPRSNPVPFVEAKGLSVRPGVLPEPRWPDSNLPLKVYISGTVAAARDGLVSHEIKSALRQWREASNGRLYYVLTDHYVDADIVFVCENTSEHQWAENIAEYHNNMYNRVRINLLEDTLLKLDPHRVRAVCLHEVGHAFGIRNHSTDKRDAMSLAATDDFHPILGLSNNDKKLIAKLYP